MGKYQANKWTKDKWFRLNPPDMYGYYDCAICHEPVIMTKVSLDHKYPASIYPELKDDVNNLQPTHVFCNQEKGNGKDSTRRIARYGRHKGRKR